MASTSEQGEKGLRGCCMQTCQGEQQLQQNVERDLFVQTGAVQP
jgi:hypothetical protein